MFFGWRFQNRDEHLDRWLSATFEWDEMGGPDMVLGAVIKGKAQTIVIGIEPPNGDAIIEFRPKSGMAYNGVPVGLQYWREAGSPSRWRMAHTGATTDPIVGRITAPHLGG